MQLSFLTYLRAQEATVVKAIVVKATIIRIRSRRAGWPADSMDGARVQLAERNMAGNLRELPIRLDLFLYRFIRWLIWSFNFLIELVDHVPHGARMLSERRILKILVQRFARPRRDYILSIFHMALAKQDRGL